MPLPFLVADRAPQNAVLRLAVVRHFAAGFGALVMGILTMTLADS